MAKIYSYVVRYDSGFAPNPFYGYCTLATCKPDIRCSAAIDDWIVGSASNEPTIRRGGHLVYAMRVTETLTFDDYATDSRFAAKKPIRTGSRKQSCGDSIYISRHTQRRLVSARLISLAREWQSSSAICGARHRNKSCADQWRFYLLWWYRPSVS